MGYSQKSEGIPFVQHWSKSVNGTVAYTNANKTESDRIRKLCTTLRHCERGTSKIQALAGREKAMNMQIVSDYICRLWE